MSRAGWINDPQWKMREDHLNPAMRPSMDLLLSKLRKLSSLVGKPDAVLWIVDQLLYQFFVREEQRPAHLWAHITKQMHRFEYMMGGHLTPRDQAEMEFIWGPPVLETAGGDSPQSPKTEKGSILVLGKSDQESPKLIDLNDPFYKRGLEAVLLKHQFSSEWESCMCRRPMKDDEAWATHIRLRVWRYLKGDVAAED